MPIKAIIFDFNGTLFWDTEYHEQAWDIYFKNHGILLEKNAKAKILHGKSNQDIFTSLFHRKGKASEIANFIKEKESIYQDLCVKANLKLAPGASSLLDFLRFRKLPFCIATSSGIENIKFYIKHLDLERWFELSQIVFNDGTMRGKPAPDIFLKAYRILKVSGRDVLIFEDSVSGIVAARKARPGKIIIVNSRNQKYSWFNYPRITHFDQFDRGIFEQEKC